jgi:hypothetical protein
VACRVEASTNEAAAGVPLIVRVVSLENPVPRIVAAVPVSDQTMA